jgi:hypothetical protein
MLSISFTALNVIHLSIAMVASSILPLDYAIKMLKEARTILEVIDVESFAQKEKDTFQRLLKILSDTIRQGLKTSALYSEVMSIMSLLIVKCDVL